ncbi:MAG: tRNA (adenosine(37)-N6)-threonylcarbamoyltransferase complex transferase subunit TsaD [Candidatus Aenigmarchaeota archaeon]|nr:tRNA (adenosine(37)-N6)-threonylcarbamoyltransferase complex transferase subunit TsaD [Candidatus Aenigmarchaeota archaeon]
MVILGIESTAHTFSIGVVRQKAKSDDLSKISLTKSSHEDLVDIEILANEIDVYKPEKGGIDPDICTQHHKQVKEQVLQRALEKAGIGLDKVSAIAYSHGPGLPPCLLVGSEFAKELSDKYHKPVLQINHCIAHIEIAKLFGKMKDPIALYVSGGNTQVIGFAGSRYRVFGETMDIGIGNALDSFGRAIGISFPAGPEISRLWQLGNKRRNYIELPYVVKGMDLSFSGIVSDAARRYKAGNKSDESIEDLCFSFQETTFAMLTEVTERALSHTKKNELILTGGVAAAQRLREMLSIMCKERNAKFYACPIEYAGDNGAMIAYTGLLLYKFGKNKYNTNSCSDSQNSHNTNSQQVGYDTNNSQASHDTNSCPVSQSSKNSHDRFNANWRTDDVEIGWM